MATPGVLLAQSFKSITCFGRAFHMKGAFAVMADDGSLGLASVLKHAGHFRLQYKWGLGSHGQQEHERYGVDESVMGKRTVHVSGGWQHSWSMGVVSHSHHGLGRDGASM